jgi:D-alanine-D-alanine ligase
MKTIAVLFGSRSTEHDVSIVTAISSVIKPLRLLKKYRVLPVYITKDGAWYADEKLGDISLYSSGKIDSYLKSTKPVSLELVNGLVILKRTAFGKTRRIKIDVAFPATHGTYGEDGSLMGFLRMANVPFIGCDMEASVIAMNKLLSHQVVSAAGIKSHPYVGLKKHDFNNNQKSAIKKINKLKYPLFVKPVHLGSSIGITRVPGPGELEAALHTAFSYDETVIVEEAIVNLIEVTVPIVGLSNDPRIGLVERPLFATDEIFDFDKKYMQQGKGKLGTKTGESSGAQGYSELPANLPKDLYEQCESLAKKVYEAIGCSGIARVDLLINSKTNQVFFNEVNPLPGSLYVHNWRRAGVPTTKLLDMLIKNAESRARESSITTSFDTNFLKQFK